LNKAGASARVLSWAYVPKPSRSAPAVNPRPPVPQVVEPRSQPVVKATDESPGTVAQPDDPRRA